MIATYDGTSNKNLIGPIDKLLSNKRTAKDSSVLKEIEYRIKYLEILFFGKTKFGLQIRKLSNDDVEIKFNNPHTIDIYLSHNYVYLKNQNLGILVEVPTNVYRKNPRKALNNLMKQYADYYEDLYIDYVINPDNDPLSKDALKLANRIQGELEGGRIKSSRYREIVEKEGFSAG